MQEPTLFNCSLKENFLYGDQQASNDDILAASAQANASEFIEATDLGNTVENTGIALYNEVSKDIFKTGLIKTLGSQEKYDSMVDNLMKLKRQEEGKVGFKPLVNALDNRTPSQVGATILHDGY